MNAESERLREAGWDSFVVKLRTEHYVARVTTYAAPLQLEGCLPTGESFYFRARWNACTLQVSRDSPELGSNWHDTVELAGEYSAVTWNRVKGRRSSGLSSAPTWSVPARGDWRTLACGTGPSLDWYLSAAGDPDVPLGCFRCLAGKLRTCACDEPLWASRLRRL